MDKIQCECGVEFPRLDSQGRKRDACPVCRKPLFPTSEPTATIAEGANSELGLSKPTEQTGLLETDRSSSPSEPQRESASQCWQDRESAASTNQGDIAETIEVRTGAFHPIAFLCLCGVVFVLSLAILVRQQDLVFGLSGMGGSAIVSLILIAILMNRRTWIVFSHDGLALPGYGVATISWDKILNAEIVEIRAKGIANYVGIDLTPDAVGQYRMPGLLGPLQTLVGLKAGRRKMDLMLYAETLEWTPHEIVNEINKRIAQ